jgi:hypothetical protein
MRTIPHPNSFHEAVGRGIDAYSGVEAAQAILLQSILGTDIRAAYLICFAVQNSRSRVLLIGELLTLNFGNEFEEYWGSCSTFLGTLAKFRNAIAHWHPHLHVYSNGEKTRYVPSIGPPVPNELPHIREGDIPPFVEDCYNISKAIQELSHVILTRPETLPEKFRQPIAYQNQAVLQPPPKPKEPQPLRPPSVLKLTEEEWIAKSRKEGRSLPED